MKNQYFGDVNDYRKYGLLRVLSSGGKYRIGVCWMLTADDGRTDGKFTNYLNTPQRWRHYDPPLFDLLLNWIISEQNRSVELAQSDQMLPRAEFYGELLIDSLEHRARYFKQAKERFANCDLIFYDPDNGTEIKSIAKGHRNSAKYLYWDELRESFEVGHSILVYQHFRREERVSFIQRMVREYENRLNPSKVYWFRTPQVVYFLNVQANHVDFIDSRVKSVFECWGKQIQCG